MRKLINYLIPGVVVYFGFANLAYAETTMSAEGL